MGDDSPVSFDSETIDGHPLRLSIIRTPTTTDSSTAVAHQTHRPHWVELRLQHLAYGEHLRRRTRNLVAFVALYVLLVASCGRAFGGYPLDGLAFGVAVLLLKRAYQTVESETVLLSGHLALEVSSTFAWGRWVQRHLLPVASVNDVIVSEVFHNLQVIYTLNALIEKTQGGKLHSSIVPLLLTRARVDILQKMYQEIQAVLKGQ